MAASSDDAAAKLRKLCEVALSSDLKPHARRKFIRALRSMRGDLDALERDVDQVRPSDAFFDPAEPRLIGHFMALALIAQDRCPRP